MTSIPPCIARFDEDEIQTIFAGQGIRLGWEEPVPWIKGVKTSFSGKLTLQTAGGDMNEHFCLDTEESRITLTQRSTAFYREMLVHIDGSRIGSYVDLDLGPYLKMNLQDASLEHMEALLQRIRFTVPSGRYSPSRPGLRVIAAELQEQGSGQVTRAQTVVNVVVPHGMNPSVAIC